MLDEFFMVRVAGLTGQAAAGVNTRSADGRTPKQTLAESRPRHRALQAAIEDSGPKISGRLLRRKRSSSAESRSSTRRSASLDERFEREIYPVLTPLAVGPGQPFPYISATVGQPRALRRGSRQRRGPVRAASRCRKVLPRLLPVGPRGRFLPLEQVLAHYLPRLFPGMDVLERRCSA